MFLTSNNLAHYLLTRGQVHASEIVDGDFMVIEAGRRNRNFKVLRGEAPGLFVKQVPMLVPETMTSLHREAVCYQLARDNPRFSSLKDRVPRMLDYDSGRHTLTVELVKDGENLNEFHSRVKDVPEFMGTLLARELANYHGAARQMLAAPSDLAAFPRTPPWVLSVAHDAESVMPNMSPGHRQLIAVLRQSPDMVAAMDALRAAWQYQSLIHGDVKWDNFLLVRDEGGTLSPRLIDWELADIGDPAWDVACLFGAYLLHWLMQGPGARPHPGPGFLWPALRAFWHEYARVMGLPSVQSGWLLLRCTRLTGARLVLSAFEMLPSRPTLTPEVARLLQLARTVLNQPQLAARELLGLAPFFQAGLT